VAEWEDLAAELEESE